MVLKKSLSAIGLAACLFGGPMQAETLIVAHGLAPTHPIAVNGMTAWLECVKSGSAEELNFNEFPSGQIADYKSAIDALNSGLADVSVVIVAYSSEKLPLNGMVNLPSEATTGVQMTEAWRDEIDRGAELAKELSAAGLHPILLNLQPPQQFVSRKGKITTLADFKGLLIRASGGSINMMVQALGGTPVEISLPDLYIALQRGTIDAGPVALSSVRTYSLEEVVKSVSTNGSFSTGGTIFAISRDRYAKLSERQQRLVDDCGRKVETTLAAKLEELNKSAITDLVAAGVEVYEFSPELLTEITAAYQPVGAEYVARLEARGIAASEAYKAYSARLSK